MTDRTFTQVLTKDSSREVTGRLQETLLNYLRWHRIEGSTEATLKYYRKELGLFIRWLGADRDPAGITVMDVLGHLEYMREEGLRPASIRTRFGAVRSWCRWMLDWEIISQDPTVRIKTPRVPREPKPFMDGGEFQRLLALCPVNTLLGARRQAMLWLFATSGIRRNEMFMLQVRDVDFDAEGIQVIHGKGQRARWVEFHREAQRPMLHYLQQRHLKDYNSEWLWVTEEGRRLMWHGIGQDMKRLQERAGVNVRDCCHAFRRTYPAYAQRQGIPDHYIMRNTGWRTPQMLHRYTADMVNDPQAKEVLQGYRPFGGKG